MEPESKATETRYGLRYFQCGVEIRLLQIAGGGRVLLADAGRRWWSRAPRHAAWQVYETGEGQTYGSRGEAESVAVNLSS